MEPGIVFNEAAFNHGLTEADIRHAIKTKIYDAPMVGFMNKYAVIGFDTAGNLLEVMYNPIDEDSINVFHAMKCRKSFLVKLGFRR
jgi:hypothetical protein